VATSGSELEVNATGEHVPLLLQRRAAAGGDRCASKISKRTSKGINGASAGVDLGPVMAKIDGVSGFKRSQTQVQQHALAYGMKRKKLRTA
jgi:hypothetical protein